MNRKELLIFLLACVIKVAIAVSMLFSHQGGKAGIAGMFAVIGGDTFSYVDPVENLFQHGIYAQDIARVETYAGRMPGYGIVYAALRTVAQPGTAADGVVGLQLLLSLVSIYCLARLAQFVTKRPESFYWAALLYALNTYSTWFDIKLLTESFATSAAIIGIYTLCQAHCRKSNALFLCAGLSLAWMVFLRPFLAPLFVLITGIYVLRELMTNGRITTYFRQTVFRGALLVLPFIIADGAWITRNWAWYHRPVPLQIDSWAGYKTAPGLKELTSFIGTIGDEPVWWYQPSDMAWFYKPDSDPANNFQGEQSKLAPPAYTYDSLVQVRHNLVLAKDTAAPVAARQAAGARAAKSLVAYESAYRRLRPGYAFLVVPGKLAYQLTLAHGSDYLFQQSFAELTLVKKITKIFFHLWYFLVVGLGLLGLLVIGWKTDFETLMVKLTPIYIVVLLCVVLHQVESRYFALAYPFVVINCVLIMLRVYDYGKRKLQANTTSLRFSNAAVVKNG